VATVTLLVDARRTGESAVSSLSVGWRRVVQRRLRAAIGVRGAPPAICTDPDEAYLPVDGATRLVHGDLPSMLIGGVASLLLQILHPLTMIAVAEHSRYREDPLGRLARTAAFVRATTFGSRAEASRAIAQVRAVHAGVHGTTSDGVAYRAGDPDLLRWVHVAELSMFLAASEAYGTRPISPEIADRYVEEMAFVALALGATDVPGDRAGLAGALDAFRPDLRLIDEGFAARDFVIRGVSRAPVRQLTYSTIAAAAIGIMPDWSRRELRLPTVPLADALVVRPSATALCAALRFAVPPAIK
jgi:uncharacterized protein (DUF2236 family)